MRHIYWIGSIVAVCLSATACKQDKPTSPAASATLSPAEPAGSGAPGEPAVPAATETRPAETPSSPDVPGTGALPAAVANAAAPPAGSAHAPGGALESIEGLSVSLKPAAGRALVVVFWNTRDSGMDAQAKAAVVLYRRFHAKGLDMVSVCSDASVDRVTDFAERWQFPWPQVMNAWGGENKPFDQFKIEKTPACLLLKPAGEPLPLKLDAVDETHAAVAKALAVKLDDLPMPDPPSRFADPGRRQMDVMSELRMAVMTEAGESEVADAVAKVLEEDDSRVRVDEVVDLLCESMRKQFPAVVQQAMEKISPEARVRMVRAVMVKAGDGLECLIPAVKKMGSAEETLEKVTRWDRSQLGRALVLAGEYEKGAAVLRKVAEEAEGESAWWYMVGWAELCGGRAGPGKEALGKSYKPDGEYSGGAAKMGGQMAGYFLGKMDEQAYLEAQGERVARFFIGERHMLSGEKEQAIEAYNACIKASKKSADPWPCNWARLRLKQLDGKEPGLPKPLAPDARPWG